MLSAVLGIVTLLSVSGMLAGCAGTPGELSSAPVSSEETAEAAKTAGAEAPAVETADAADAAENAETAAIDDPAEEETPEEPVPPMNRNQLMLAVTRAAGQRYTPVRRSNGTPLMTFFDIDRNGELDAFVLTVEANGASPFEQELGNVGRLYEANSDPVNYYLSVYFQIDGRLISMYRIPFGGRMVLDGFRSFSLNRRDTFPYTVEVSFQNRDGIALEWVIFSSYNKFSLFSLRRSVTVGTYTEDIDGDNLLDVVEWRKGIEEGTGYETFLTWYRWNGSSMREKGSTNIVRNLNAFLSGVEEAVLSGKPETLLPYLTREPEGGPDSGKALAGAIFTPLDEDIPEDFDEICSSIASIVYAPILESPFVLDSPEGRSFPLDLRLVCRGGDSLLCRMEIALARNPFSEPQYKIVVR